MKAHGLTRTNTDEHGRRYGYVLVETLVALTILSISAMGIQRAIGQAVQLRGLAQDYGTVQLIATNVLSQLDIKYFMLHEETRNETLPAPFERFRYALEISQVDVPRPELPARIDPAQRKELEKRYHGKMPKIKIEVFWQRSGVAYSRVFETLMGPERLWVPPPKDGVSAP